MSTTSSHRHILFTSLAAFLFFSFSCSQSSNQALSDSTDPNLADISLFLSGSPLPANSSILKYTEDNTYRSFSAKINDLWKTYRTNSFEPIRKWSAQHCASFKNETCFYPFAGADFINAYNIYPSAKTYILIGLETAGAVPAITELSSDDLKKGYSMLLQGYSTFSKFNFYRTYGMEVDMEKSPFSGTMPHILNQMGWLGIKPVAAFSVEIDNGELRYTPAVYGKNTQHGAIDFIDTDGTRKRVVFLHIDLENAALEANSGAKKFIESLTDVSGIFKAASYLPPRENFSIIRDICLKNMNSIVQDDSAIPYRYFTNGWQTTLFGRYTTSNKKFPSYKQNDLKIAYATTRPQTINFRFCYDMPDNGSNIMIALKK